MTVEVKAQTARLPLVTILSRKFDRFSHDVFGVHDRYFDTEGTKTLCVKQFDLAEKTIKIVEGKFNATIYNLQRQLRY